MFAAWISSTTNRPLCQTFPTDSPPEVRRPRRNARLREERREPVVGFFSLHVVVIVAVTLTPRRVLEDVQDDVECIVRTLRFASRVIERWNGRACHANYEKRRSWRRGRGRERERAPDVKVRLHYRARISLATVQPRCSRYIIPRGRRECNHASLAAIHNLDLRIFSRHTVRNSLRASFNVTRASNFSAPSRLLRLRGR